MRSLEIYGLLFNIETKTDPILQDLQPVTLRLPEVIVYGTKNFWVKTPPGSKFNTEVLNNSTGSMKWRHLSKDSIVYLCK